MSQTEVKQERFHYIDGFRAIASVLIVLHHSVSSNIYKVFHKFGLDEIGIFIWNLTGSGVNFFFVISGLVLLRPYLRGERTLNTGMYFKKRFMRIYPTYAAAVVFGSAVIWYINTFPTWYNEKGIHVSFTLETTLRQLLMFNLDGVFYNLAWWSVGVEALFYMLVPIIIFTFPSRHKLSNNNVIVLIALSIVGTIGLQFFSDRYLPSFYSFTKILLNTGRIVDYPVCFLMGVLLAARDFTVRQAYYFILAGTIMFSFQYIYQPMMHVGYGLFYAGIIIITFSRQSWQQFMSKPIFLWVGERSYSLFLVHLSVFYLINNLAAHFTTSRGALYGLITRGFGIPLAFLVSMILFQVVECRFARGLITDKMIWPWQKSKLKIE